MTRNQITSFWIKRMKLKNKVIKRSRDDGTSARSNSHLASSSSSFLPISCHFFSTHSSLSMIALAFFINFTSSSHHFFGYARAIKSPNPTTQSSIITRSIVYRFTFSTLHFKTCTLLPRQIVHCKITTMKMKIIPSNASSLSSLCELCVVVAAAASDAAVFKFCLKIMFLFDYRKPNKKISESKWRAEKRISMHFLVWIFFLRFADYFFSELFVFPWTT